MFNAMRMLRSLMLKALLKVGSKTYFNNVPHRYSSLFLLVYLQIRFLFGK